MPKQQNTYTQQGFPKLSGYRQSIERYDYFFHLALCESIDRGAN